MLKQLNEFPQEIFKLKAHELHRVLEGPTLFHLKGKIKEPLFLSILLHGNETSGFEAIKNLLTNHQAHGLPRSLSIFLGNIQAAQVNQRRLHGQLDYNRVWQIGPHPENEMAMSIFNEMKSRNVFASIDLHNNTGNNPHYACINRLEAHFFSLAKRFSKTIVYFIKPEGVQSSAFSNLCPSVTLECGHNENQAGAEHALNYIENILELRSFPNEAIHLDEIGLYHTLARILVPEPLSVGLEKDVDIQLIPELDQLNFHEQDIGTLLGYVQAHQKSQLIVLNDAEQDIADQYFTYENNEIRTKRKIMPSMLTLNTQVIKQDCLGYIMERITDLKTLAVS